MFGGRSLGGERERDSYCAHLVGGVREENGEALTWVKFTGLSRQGGHRVLELIGGGGGARPVHGAVGGHIRAVGRGRVVLGILVLAEGGVGRVVLKNSSRRSLQSDRPGQCPLSHSKNLTGPSNLLCYPISAPST